MSRLNVNIAQNKSSVLFTREDGHQQRCSGKWLRRLCACQLCKSESTMKYLVKAAEAVDVTIEKVVITDNELRCVISSIYDGHETIVPLESITDNCNCPPCIKTALLSCKVKPRSIEKSTPYFEYKDTLTDEGKLRFLEGIIDNGFSVVRNFPTDEKSARDFGKSFGFIRSTLYEKSFQVRSALQPINAAYTAFKLPSHQDIVFYESSPGVQYLLARRFDKEVKGGETKIVDVIRCAEILREKYPEHFETFCRVPASFHTIDMNRPIPCWIKNTKPHIELDSFDEIVAVNWHPPHEATLRVREKDIEAYYEAHKTFMNIVNDPSNGFMFRLQTGDFLILNNHRVSHSREAYTSLSDGDRHLLGLYIEMDDLKSTFMTLAENLGVKINSTKFGSRSSF